MKKALFLSVFAIFFTVSCSIDKEEINYGKEGCHYCTMTIVDNQHASELVTTKGKVFKYDAIECLINDLKKRDTAAIGLLFVNDYGNPGDLIAAEKATFLISKGVPSPMGAFLSAFSTKEAAVAVQSEKGGETYSWQEVKKVIK